MKKITLAFLKNVCKLFAIFWSYEAGKNLYKIKTKLYTFWISKEFKNLGNEATIGFPIVLKGGKYISVGDQTTLGRRGVLTAWDKFGTDLFYPEISIGNNTSIGEDFHITAINNITIGNNVLMGKKITITDNSHGISTSESLSQPPQKRPLFSKGPVTIEDGVWIGDKATILSNVKIGRNSIIGANAVVVKDIPSNCVVGGVPAVILKKISQ